MRLGASVAVVAIGCLAAACAQAPLSDPRYPRREMGCDVQVFRGAVPPDLEIRYDDLGRAGVTCSDDIAESDCLRELMDQACKQGGDILYDVPRDPSEAGHHKVRYEGRVAHTRRERDGGADSGKKS